MFKNFENFIYSSEKNFPKDSCTVQDEKEKDVYYGNDIYMVLYIDKRFKSEKSITYAKPYIYDEHDGTFSYGWEAEYSSEVFGNVENSCQFYDEFVVGFIKVDDEMIKENDEQFTKYVKLIEKYEQKAYEKDNRKQYQKVKERFIRSFLFSKSIRSLMFQSFVLYTANYR